MPNGPKMEHHDFLQTGGIGQSRWGMEYGVHWEKGHKTAPCFIMNVDIQEADKLRGAGY
jgi:hypothetical protein